MYYANTKDVVLEIQDRIIVTANPRCKELFGYEPDRMVGRSILDFCPEHQPDGVRSADRWLRLVSAKRDSEQHDNWSILTSTDHTVPCEMVVWRLGSTADKRMLVAIRDVSQQKSVEDELRTKTAQLESTLESLPFDFWINDADNRTVMQNSFSKKLWGEQFGHHMEEVAADPDILAVWRKTNDRALKGEVIAGEISYNLPEGQRVFRNIVAPIRAGETILGILGLNIDITDYKEALHEREVLLRELHHRVKNNLQLLISMLNLRIDKAREDHRNLLREIEQQIYTVYLVHDHLFTHEQFDLVDLRTYLEELVSALRQGMAAQGQHRDVECQCQSFLVPIDRAISIGVIINEITTDCLKQVGTREPSERISIELFQQSQESIVLRVQSCHSRHGVEPGRTADSFGLVEVLCGQLGGSMRNRPGNTYLVEITFDPATLLGGRN